MIVKHDYLVEILLATYNGEKYLTRQIESIITQTSKKWKLFIRDDGSTDGTIKIIEDYVQKYPNKINHIISDKKNIGSTLNFSRLLENAGDNYIMFCDQDDIWLSNKIQISMEKMIELESSQENLPCLVFSDLVVVDDDENVISSSFWQQSRHIHSNSSDLYTIIANSMITGCTILLNKFAKNTIKKIPTNIIQHDHWVSIIVAYFGKIGFLNEPTVLYRQHSNNAVGSNDVNFKYLFKKIFSIPKIIHDWKAAYSKLPFKVIYSRVLISKIIYNLKRLTYKNNYGK